LQRPDKVKVPFGKKVLRCCAAALPHEIAPFIKSIEEIDNRSDAATKRALA
jgi:hypothetical protein